MIAQSIVQALNDLDSPFNFVMRQHMWDDEYMCYAMHGNWVMIVEIWQDKIGNSEIGYQYLADPNCFNKLVSAIISYRAGICEMINIP